MRFALDDATWRRLRGCCDALPDTLQAGLDDLARHVTWSDT